MSNATRRIAAAVLFALAGPGAFDRTCRAADVLFDPATANAQTVQTNNAKADVIRADGNAFLRVRPTGRELAEVTFAPAEGAWDLSRSAGLAMTVRNPNASPVILRLTAFNPDAKGLMNVCRNAVELRAGESREVFMRLTRRPEDPTYAVFNDYYMYFKGINVRDNTIDPARVTKVVLGVDGQDAGKGLEISAIRPSGEGVPAPVPFFPFIDEYGQYAHGDWPGKIFADTDFADRRQEEIKEQAGWSGPDEWNEYGGWAKGPQLKATGFFYAAKHNGKWWLVDPAGRLFWSYGPTGVGFGGDVTPVTDREHWFAALPPKDSPLARFYKDGQNATYRYYQHRSWRGYDIQGANLFRKYGPDYEKDVAKISHDRLRSWGFNTLGGWSDPKVYGLKRTAYTVAIHYGSPLIHYRMPDVYDPAWEPAVRRRMEQERDRTAGDAWNLGYFVDNERWFGWRPRAAAIGEETLKNPPERAAKVKFVGLLKDKYKTIAALNAAWAASHDSWDALLAHRQTPDMKNAKVLEDCGDFGMTFSERYFSVCRSAVKAVAPDNLYLGSRFYGHTDPAVVALAAKHVDVIAYNIYDNPPDGRANQYAKIDKPLMSTEWGVGSDPFQTPFRNEKLTAQPPAERAAEMARYTERALKLKNMVGAHFFQYRDQPLSGRPDGEATLRGFINVADTPNFELVQANRRIAYRMYQIRSEAK